MLKIEMDEHQDQVLNQSLMPCTLSKTSIQSIIAAVNKKNKNEASCNYDLIFKLYSI